TDASVQLLVLDRRDHLDTTVEVARHPVGRSKIHLLIAVIREIEDSRVLEKAPDDAYHTDLVADTWDSRSQATDAADDQIDVHAGLRRIVQVLNDFSVDERIHLGDDARPLSRPRVLGFAIDHLPEAV